MYPYFSPFGEFTMTLLAKVSSMETSSRMSFTSFTLPSFFCKVRVTSVPFSPRMSLTASSTSIPTTLTASSFGLDFTFRILSPSDICLDFHAGAPTTKGPMYRYPFFSWICAPIPITFPAKLVSKSSLSFGEK